MSSDEEYACIFSVTGLQRLENCTPQISGKARATMQGFDTKTPNVPIEANNTFDLYFKCLSIENHNKANLGMRSQILF